jgi:hypothetical protein
MTRFGDQVGLSELATGELHAQIKLFSAQTQQLFIELLCRFLS